MQPSHFAAQLVDIGINTFIRNCSSGNKLQGSDTLCIAGKVFQFGYHLKGYPGANVMQID